jgi:hypothetical protein
MMRVCGPFKFVYNGDESECSRCPSGLTFVVLTDAVKLVLEREAGISSPQRNGILSINGVRCISSVLCVLHNHVFYRSNASFLTRDVIIAPSIQLRFPYNPEIWLRMDGSIPTHSWFMLRLRRHFASDVAGQSPRSGGATALTEAGVAPHLIQAIGLPTLSRFISANIPSFWSPVYTITTSDPSVLPIGVAHISYQPPISHPITFSGSANNTAAIPPTAEFWVGSRFG